MAFAKTGKGQGSWLGARLGERSSIEQQMMPFMFEIYDPTQAGEAGVEANMLLPYNPEMYKMVYAPRANITYTQGGLFEDNIGLTPPKFSLSGIFGLVGTTVVGVSKSLNTGESKTGLTLYHEFEQMVLEFYERFGAYQLDGAAITKAPDKKNPVQIRFYNFCDREYWIVQINQFTLTRNTQRRHLYQYDIQMTGLARINNAGANRPDLVKTLNLAMNARISSLGVAKVATLADKIRGWSNYVSQIQQQVVGPIQKVTAFMGEITSAADKLKYNMTSISTAVANAKNGLTEVVHIPLGLVKTAHETTNSVIKSIVAIGNLPHEFLRDMRSIKRLLMGYERQPHLFRVETTTSTSTDTSTDSAQDILTVPIPNAVSITDFTSTPVPEETLFANQPEKEPVSVSQLPIQDNDTIQTIANRSGIDWKQIAAVNGLEYPYIVRDIMQQYSPILESGWALAPAYAGDTTVRVQNILPQPGNILLIQTPDGYEAGTVYASVAGTIELTGQISKDIPAGSIITRHERAMAVLLQGEFIMMPGTGTSQPILNNEEWGARLFGIDEELNPEGFMADRGLADISVKVGISNLEMQLRHRIMTTRGELSELGHPEYGSLVPVFIGKISVPVWQERIFLECQLAVLDDPRVDHISNPVMLVDGTSYRFETDVYPNNQSSPVQIAIPIG